MGIEERRNLFNSSLERAANLLGDITPRVLELYFSRCPDALDAFEHHRPGSAARLQSEMVSQTLYCLMEWLENPLVVEILLMGTIPHHLTTLHVSPQHFLELIRATSHTIMATIPATANDERAVWEELQHDLEALFAEGAQGLRLETVTLAMPAGVPGPS